MGTEVVKRAYNADKPDLDRLRDLDTDIAAGEADMFNVSPHVVHYGKIIEKSIGKLVMIRIPRGRPESIHDANVKQLKKLIDHMVATTIRRNLVQLLHFRSTSNDPVLYIPVQEMEMVMNSAIPKDHRMPYQVLYKNNTERYDLIERLLRFAGWFVETGGQMLRLTPIDRLTDEQRQEFEKMDKPQRLERSINRIKNPVPVGQKQAALVPARPQ